MLCEFCVLLQKPLALSISAGDNPFLRMDLVLIPRGFFFSSVSRRVPAERKYLAKHDKERGSRDVEKKNQTEERETREECFSVTGQPGSSLRKKEPASFFILTAYT